LFTVGDAATPNGNLITVDDNTAAGVCAFNPGAGANWACTSDARLKENVIDINSSDSLAKILALRTVNYNFIGDTTGTHYDGFLAQEFQQVIPHGVVTNPDGYLAVNESSMLPYMVGAIKELDLNINQIETFAQNTDGTDSVFVTKLREWLASATNGVTDLFTKKIHSEQICLKKADGSEYCVDGDQLQSIINNQGTVVSGGGTSPSNPPTDPTDTLVDGGSTTQVDPNNSGSTGGETISPTVDPVPDTGSGSIPIQ
jgi:hypothetical protein